MPPEKPPCGTCRLELFDENKDAGKIFLICRRQVITAGMGDVIDINILAVKAVMDICNIQDQEICLDKVIKLFRISQQNQKDKKDKNPKQNKGNRKSR